MQILEIVLYGRNGAKRVVSFRPGEVNIITGQSHTGKTSLIAIVSYCLGGSSFYVPEGRILEAVAWFGLLLQVGDGRVFVARKNPYPAQSSTSTAFLLRGITESPDAAPADANTSLEALEANLTQILGIAPNLHVPPITSTRLPLAANIRHALFYCFQHQTEIANNQILFHRQAADFLTSAIRDTLPYFLGAIREDELALEEQLSIAKRKLKLLENQQRENEQIQGEGVSRASALLQEAISIGVLADQALPESVSELRDLMVQATSWEPGRSVFAGLDRISQLQDELNVLKEQRAQLSEAIRTARVVSGEAQGFVDEARIQAERLESIGLFDPSAGGNEDCPYCSQHLAVPIPSAEAIQSSLVQLSQSLRATERARPRLREYIIGLNDQMEALLSRETEKEEAINALLNEQQAAQLLRDQNSRQAKVVGRLSLYLESVQPEAGNTGRLSRDIEIARREVDRLAEQLDPESKEQRLGSILNRLGLQMSEWARFLKLQFSGSPVRLDLSSVTVVVDEDRPIPLIRLGSGENWLGCHLITLLALHRHFRQNRRPVPGFLILDQPSQVYFPADEDPLGAGYTDSLTDDDRQKLSRMFELIFNAVAELTPDFQIIITEHADLSADPVFQNAIVAKWRGPGKALVPENW
jgi:hypothetical protein